MKLITANKLNRLFNNGIKPLFNTKIDKTRVLTTSEQVQANTNEENIVGALVFKELNNSLSTKMPNDVKLITEGSGANTKYYIQLGADAASKKLLGSSDFEYVYDLYNGEGKSFKDLEKIAKSTGTMHYIAFNIFSTANLVIGGNAINIFTACSGTLDATFKTGTINVTKGDKISLNVIHVGWQSGTVAVWYIK